MDIIQYQFPPLELTSSMVDELLLEPKSLENNSDDGKDKEDVESDTKFSFANTHNTIVIDINRIQRQMQCCITAWERQIHLF